jgi:hypothetical protein
VIVAVFARIVTVRRGERVNYDDAREPGLTTGIPLAQSGQASGA